MPKFAVFFFSTLLFATSAMSMTCLNDYSGDGQGCAKISTAAGDCTTLGYSNKKELGCTKWLYCPFDSSYKRCLEYDSLTKVCSADVYPFDKCPGALVGKEDETCIKCQDGDGWHYACKSGLEYIDTETVNGVTIIAHCGCIPKTCTDYKLASCPNLATCASCTDNCDTKRYNFTSCVENASLVNGECVCNDGYFAENNKCVSCADSQEYKELSKISGNHYWLGLSGNYPSNYLSYSSVNTSVSVDSSGDGFQIDDGFTTNDIFSTGCASWGTDTNVCSCYKTKYALRKRVDTYNQQCPTLTVSMPGFDCNNACLPPSNGVDAICIANSCSSLSCSQCETQGRITSGACAYMGSF